MLTDAQREIRDNARAFAAQIVAPNAFETDRSECISPAIFAALRSSVLLNGAVPTRHGGAGMDALTYGLLTEEIGRACASVRSLMTVQNMFLQTLLRFGTSNQKRSWLPDFVAGDRIAAFALSETQASSTAGAMICSAAPKGDDFVLSGQKSWISFGQRADVFLVFAKVDDQPTAFIVPRDAQGMSLRPRHDMLGTRGAMLADLTLNDVVVPGTHVLGNVGAGLSFVANIALDHGRYSVAWGTLGTLRGCLEACLDYAENRNIGGVCQKDLPLAQQALADMWVSYETAQAMCMKAASARAEDRIDAAVVTSAAKYYAAQQAIAAANTAVRLHGANGCSADYAVNRHLRDATVAGIIEGPPESHVPGLARHALQRRFLD